MFFTFHGLKAICGVFKSPFGQKLDNARRTHRESLPGGLVAASLRQTVRRALPSLCLFRNIH
ncbi:hypothetical protein KCM76_03285 [Zooshikella marina]|uniref:hypothetical protein n=1 Tax=Zooshikella ganghwensis TaxID=202772 RepID=UPI001BAE80FB|nr:hypothetical protein [Zooshikella ganghwensis]MBU2704987.1 hypothetical protein [Zooshikella ganghwensis]